MSTRTIIEINHDCLRESDLAKLMGLWHALHSSEVPRLLNMNDGKPVRWANGLTILGQRHHSETLKLEVK